MYVSNYLSQVEGLRPDITVSGQHDGLQGGGVGASLLLACLRAPLARPLPPEAVPRGQTARRGRLLSLRCVRASIVLGFRERRVHISRS